MNFADPTFGIQAPATVILLILAGEPAVFPLPKTKKTPGMRLRTYPWFNGREKGACVVATRDGVHGLVLAFGEERSSEAIFVDVWRQVLPASDQPTIESSGQAYAMAYANRTRFDHHDYAGAVSMIKSVIRAYEEETR